MHMLIMVQQYLSSNDWQFDWVPWGKLAATALCYPILTKVHAVCLCVSLLIVMFAKAAEARGPTALGN